MVGSYHWIHQEDFNEAFGGNAKSDLTTSSSQKSQCWDYPTRILTMGWIPR
jgi:hypothetical protein